MHFKARLQFGRTRQIVSWLPLALLKHGQMMQAIRNLAHRDELFIVLYRPMTYFLDRLVERWLRRLGVGQIDAALW